MTISNTDNIKKMQNSADMIKSLKQVLKDFEIKQVVMLLQNVKQPQANVKSFCEEISKIFFNGDDNPMKATCFKQLI